MTLLISKKSEEYREIYADKRITNAISGVVRSEKATKIFNGNNLLVASSGYTGAHVVFEIIDRIISFSTETRNDKKNKHVTFLDSLLPENNLGGYRSLDGIIPVDKSILDSEASLTYIISEISRCFRQDESKVLDDKHVSSCILIPKTNSKVFTLDIFGYGVFLEEHYDKYLFEGSGAEMAKSIIRYCELEDFEPSMKNLFYAVSSLDGSVGREFDYFKVPNL